MHNGLFVVGGVMLAIAAIKLVIIGYYPHELAPFSITGGIGSALLLAGQKLKDGTIDP